MSTSTMAGEATGTEFDVMHRRGKKHTSADALSRLPCRQCGRDNHHSLAPVEVVATMLQPPQHDPSRRLRDSQLADSMLGHILRVKEAGEKPCADNLGSVSQSSRRLLLIWDHLAVCNGILCCQFVTPQGSSSIL